MQTSDKNVSQGHPQLAQDYKNPGIEGKQAGMTQYDVNIFTKVIDINLMGVYYGMRYVIPVMQKQKYGRIVNLASVVFVEC